MSTTGEHPSEAFFSEWLAYKKELNSAYLKYVDSKKTRTKFLPKKFPCLEEIDNHFNTLTKPILEKFFQEYPYFRLRLLETDSEIKRMYTEEIHLFWPHPHLLRKELLPPRVIIHRPLETERDVQEALESKYPGKSLKVFLKGLEGLERQDEINARFNLNRIDEVRRIIRSALWTRISADKVGLVSEPEDLKKLSKDEQESAWRTIQGFFHHDKFWEEVEKQWGACNKSVSILIDWEETIKHKRQEEKVKEAGEKGGTPAPQVETTGLGHREDTIRLKLVIRDKAANPGRKEPTKDRVVFINDTPQEELPNKPFTLLYAIACQQKLHPGVPAEKDSLYNILGWLGGKTPQKALSNHKMTIVGRIPQLKEYIPRSGGCRLTLPPEAIEIEGRLKQVDIWIEQ